jgi:transposase
MRPLVTDRLWEIVAPLLPRHRAQPKGGRPWVDDRATLNGILYVLRAGIPWKLLPTELGYGSGVTCWRRLREWQRRGVWKKLHRAMLDRLAAADQIDWSRAALDSRSLPAKGGRGRRRNPTDKGKPGSKHHVLTDRQGIPLAIALTAANVHDSRLLAPLLDAVPAIRTGRRGRPRRRPIKLHADKGYDYRRCRDACVQRGIKHRIARKGIESKTHLGRHRWVVERTLAWTARFRRLAVRYERLVAVHRAFLHLACALICFNYLQRT